MCGKALVKWYITSKAVQKYLEIYSEYSDILRILRYSAYFQKGQTRSVEISSSLLRY